jgi:malonyl CoA-acyl carrier protein transacylase
LLKIYKLTCMSLTMEPIAIIGIGCRFPGAKNPESFWHLLREGQDLITEVPLERWNIDTLYDSESAKPVRMNTRWGSFIEDVDQFDPSFFGISPRETKQIDPQHRLVLEVAWESLENAGLIPDKLAGSQTGVFIGISNSDYDHMVRQDFANLSGYSGTGINRSMAANRLSYLLDLHGPSIAVDTACSASLVAVHLACNSLQSKESDLALAGGVNLILSPQPTIILFQAKMMAADGRCKTFDASADGYVRGEGCGIVVLKRLCDALTDEDNILAIIKGSAVNQDGLSNGLTAPNGPSQQAVIRQALENAQVQPAQISYVEAHGTGTALGDPIEVQSLKTVLMQGRSKDQPCWIGSVKTNIGHLEAAAGIAGLIKVVLSLQHREIPPHLHLKQLNQYISLEGTPLSISTECQPWFANTESRLAGVSAFSFGGTNCHIILEQAPAPTAPASDIERPMHLLTLSAKSEKALQELAQSYKTYFESHPEVCLADACFTANTRRSHFEHRLAVVTESTMQLQEALLSFDTGSQTALLVNGQTQGGNSPKLAFLFTGQGSQYVGMGRQLYDTQPIFRQTLDRCDEIARPYLEKPLLSVLYPAPGESSPLDETAYTQPALFALEYALFQLWKSWGIEPAVVMGHSVGEYVAACVAGVFSLEDGLKLIAERGRLMQMLPCDGAMVSVLADKAQVVAAIQPYGNEVAIAAVNGSHNIVISGKRQAVEVVTAAMASQGVETKPLKVSHAFHSPLMEPMLAAFEEVAKEVTYSQPQIEIISNVTGTLVTSEIVTPEYWCRHVRQAVKFAAGIETLHQQGCQVFVEIGPKPTLLGIVRQCLPPEVGALLPSLRPKEDDWKQLLKSLGELYVRGVSVDWSSFDQDYPRHRVQLPTYSFQRQRYWVETNKVSALCTIQPSTERARSKSFHPLLGQRLYSALKHKEIQFESQISVNAPAFLKHHSVFKSIIMPATAYLDMALAAGSAVFKSDNLVVEGVSIQRGLIFAEEDEVKTLQLILSPDEKNGYSFQIFSLTTDEDNEEPFWVLHASGTVLVRGKDKKLPHVDLFTLLAQYNEEISVKDYYQQLRKRGIDYGLSFQAIEKLWRHQGEALGQIRLPEALMLEAQDYKLHPVLLDACFQVLGAIFPIDDEKDTYMQVGMKRLTVFSLPQECLWCYAKLCQVNGSNQKTLIADLCLSTPDGQVIAKVEGLQMKKVSCEALLGTLEEPLQNWLYEVEWHLTRFGSQQLPPYYLLTPSEISANLQPQLSQLLAQPDLEVYGEVLNQLEALSVVYVLKTLEEMEWKFQLRQRFTTAMFAKQLGVVSRHQKLLRRLLEILAEVGLLRQIGEEWEVIQLPDKVNPQEQLSTLLVQYPFAVAELTMLGHCGSNLAAVLRGECDPLQLLFPEGDLTTATKLYQESPMARVMNALIQKVFVLALEGLPQQRGMRILEIGGGTGGTTSHILPLLKAEQTEYVFTDVGTMFTTQAQERFREYAFVTYQVLDIEIDPKTQGFAEHEYDVIVAANVLHATKDLRQTLKHVQQLLAPKGMLVLLEGTARQRWEDLIFGLTEGWWRFSDVHLRSNYPLLSAAQWQKLLHEAGFEDAVTISPTTRVGTSVHTTTQELSLKQAVIMAQAKEFVPEEVVSEPKSWLILADSQGFGHQLAAQLQSRGEVCNLVFPGKEYEQTGEQEFRVDPTNPESFQQLLTVVGTNKPPLHGVVHLWSLDSVKAEALTGLSLEAALQNGCGSTLYLVKSLLKLGLSKPPSLWLVTKGAQPVKIECTSLAIEQSPLWGLGKVIATEHPELQCLLVDLDPSTDKHEVQALFDQLWIGNSKGEAHLAFRQGQTYIARMVRSNKLKPQSPLHLRSDATYLIVGGLGGTGLLVARWMVEHGAQHLVLVGRKSASAAAQETLRELEQAGAQIVVAQADVSQIEQISQVLTQIKQSMPQLRGIIQAAGIFADRLLLDHQWELFAKVFAPKVIGSWNLHTLTRDMPLDFFVLFSSVASIIGGSGLSNYVAANAFLDALAHYRQIQGLPGLSINWGVWAKVGMAQAVGSGREAQWLLQGIDPMQPQEALKIFEQLLQQNIIQLGVVRINWSNFLCRLSGKPQLKFFEAFTKKSKQSPKQKSQLLERLEAAPTSKRRQILAAHIQAEVVEVMGLDPSQPVNLQQGFFALGMDSLMSMELRNRLQTSLECSLPSTLTFKYPTIEALVDYLAVEVFSLGQLPQSDKVLQKDVQVQRQVLAEIKQLSEDEINISIAREIEELKGFIKGGLE